MACVWPEDHVERETQRQGWNRASAQRGCAVLGGRRGRDFLLRLEAWCGGWRLGPPCTWAPSLLLTGTPKGTEVPEHSLEFPALAERETGVLEASRGVPSPRGQRWGQGEQH